MSAPFTAGPWRLACGKQGSANNPRFRAWRRTDETGRTVATLSTGGGQPHTGARAWGGFAQPPGQHVALFLSSFDPGNVGPVQPERESLTEAMAALDAALVAAGGTLLSGGAALCSACGGYGSQPDAKRCTSCGGDGADPSVQP